MSDKQHILIIDDDQQIRDLLCAFFKRHDYQALQAANAQTALNLLNEIAIDLIILDWMMPKISGIEFLKNLRQNYDTRVIMLTAMGDMESRIQGLESGADDYLSKPFEPNELLLRAKAILRRDQYQHQRTQKQQQQMILHLGALNYDCNTGRLRTNYNDGRDDSSITLTTSERAIMDLLARNSDKPCTRTDIAQACDIIGDERAVDVQINRLRHKIEQDNRKPKYLITQRGKGYMLRPDYITSS